MGGFHLRQFDSRLAQPWPNSVVLVSRMPEIINITCYVTLCYYVLIYAKIRNLVQRRFTLNII